MNFFCMENVEGKKKNLLCPRRRSLAGFPPGDGWPYPRKKKKNTLPPTPGERRKEKKIHSQKRRKKKRVKLLMAH